MLSSSTRKSTNNAGNALKQQIALMLSQRLLPVAIRKNTLDNQTQMDLQRGSHSFIKTEEYLVYIPSDADSAMAKSIQTMQGQIRDLDVSNKEQLVALEMSEDQLKAAHKRHINLLHQYNELKDVVQAMIGRVAHARGVKAADLYENYGLSLGD